MPADEGSDLQAGVEKLVRRVFFSIQTQQMCSLPLHGPSPRLSVSPPGRRCKTLESFCWAGPLEAPLRCFGEVGSTSTGVHSVPRYASVGKLDGIGPLQGTNVQLGTCRKSRSTRQALCARGGGRRTTITGLLEAENAQQPQPQETY